MIEASCNAFMSKNCVSFKKKKKITKSVAQFGGEEKPRICFHQNLQNVILP
jgi:hypothetical protein